MPTMITVSRMPPLRSHPSRNTLRTCLLGLALSGLLMVTPSLAADLMQTIERVKLSVVGIGTFAKLRQPSIQFVGTGFVVADGRYVVTNAHVVDKPLDVEKRETPIVLVSRNGEPEPREAAILAVDTAHDIALLRISGEAVPALKLGDSGTVREGQMLAFTGFPIGMALGFRAATHRGMVSAITPNVLPAITARQLNAQMIGRVRDSAYMVFQLDGTAYPGNSGSPLYSPDDGTVIGVINSVFVQGTREAAISHPSGITYAIPARYIYDMLRREKIPDFE